MSSSSNLTVNPQYKTLLVGDRLIISNHYSILVVHALCGNLLNVFLYHTPTTEELQDKSKKIPTGTTQYPAFCYCTCGIAPNHGGALRNVRQSISTCTTVEDVLRLLDFWIMAEEREKK